MKYRIYENISGWELVNKVECDYLSMLRIVKELITKNEGTQILVIEHNIKEDMETPYFSYAGIYKKYEEFTEREKVRKRN